MKMDDNIEVANALLEMLKHAHTQKASKYLQKAILDLTKAAKSG